jgi:hypothetical protein
MSSQHRDKPLSVRPDRLTREAAEHVLIDRDLKMTEFVTACLRALATDPNQLLTVLQPHWPQPRPRGRPSRQAPDA